GVVEARLGRSSLVGAWTLRVVERGGSMGGVTLTCRVASAARGAGGTSGRFGASAARGAGGTSGRFGTSAAGAVAASRAGGASRTAPCSRLALGDPRSGADAT